mgnify:CR=1 FL=1
MKKCPRCGAENPDDAYFCKVCYYPLTEGVKFEVPESVTLRGKQEHHFTYSRNALVASLALNAAYHIALSAAFFIVVAYTVLTEINQTVVATIPMKYFEVLSLITVLEFVSGVVAYFAFKSNKRALIYLLYPIGLIGIFYSLTINPQTGFGYFSLVYYPSSLLVIVGGSYFAVMLRDALHDDSVVKWSTLVMMLYYFAVVLMPGLISILSLVNFASSIAIIYAVLQRGGVKVGNQG